ncbi:MAG: HAMP domain-containing histidine kinase [Lachnospiraceae bacterium]|nr:HAMP domain-containing histidine kinase [Lachnospiraceae bacterium]
MKNDKPHAVKSIRNQFALIIFLIVTMCIGLCIVLNDTLLTQYYMMNRKKVLTAAYQSLNTASSEGSVDSDDFRIKVQRISSIYNISMLIIDSDSQVVVSSENESKRLTYDLQRYIFGFVYEENESIEVLDEEADYTIQKSYDPRTGINYLEMWGFLDNANPFLIRTAMEGIQDSVKISNRFLAYVGLLAAAVGMLFTIMATKRITSPILQLADISRRMADLDFEARYEGEEENELGILGNDMNRLSEKLESTISELKTANNELQKDIEKREQLDEMRSDFLSNVSHELKTPLALIMGYAEGLKMDVNEDAESREFYCEVIADEADRMNQMVKQLLSLNQLELGNEPVSMERFDIVELIRNYIQSAKILIQQADAKVIFEEEGPVYVWGDEFLVEEVVMNYFTNALHYVAGDPKQVRIDITGKESVARISVFNTGDQIPEEAMEHLWEKFYKVDKARTREYGGTGIGLSVVKATMEAMNRDYGAINHPDGVEFWFELETKS